MLRFILLGLGFAGLAASIAFYLIVNSLACAFGNPNAARCPLTMPWELYGEDLTLMVLLPGFGVAFLFIMAWAVGRGKR